LRGVILIAKLAATEAVAQAAHPFEAFNHQVLSALFKDYDVKAVQDVVDIFAPLNGKGDVAASNLSQVHKHLGPSDRDIDAVKEMKDAVAELRPILSLLARGRQLSPAVYEVVYNTRNISNIGNIWKYKYYMVI